MAYIVQDPKDENGKHHGEWIAYHKNGKLWYRHNWFHGIEHGFNEGYFSDGRLINRGNWNMGKAIGYWYHSNQEHYYLWLI